MELIPIPRLETDSEPIIRNRFNKFSKLARFDSDQNLIFPITIVQGWFHGRELFQTCRKNMSIVS